ncbi:MAG TPA: alpha/beta hydrolase [Pilimelia sp.]|nr:alpha/beta hydrolase [Pilimelia sp.]
MALRGRRTGPAGAVPAGWSPGHRVAWYAASERPLRALVAGRRRPGTPPVVLVPGLGCVRSMVEALHATGAWTRGTLLDLPGAGHDGPDACAPTVAAVADTLATWLAQRSAPVVLAGHSTGAQAALRAAVAVPAAVAALVLAGPTFAPRDRRPDRLVRDVLRTAWHEPKSSLLMALPDYRRAGVRGLARYVLSGLRDRPEEFIGRVDCPVLVARGRHDRLAPTGWIRALAQAAPDGHAVTVPGAHAFPWEHPGRFAQLLADAAARAAQAGARRPGVPVGDAGGARAPGRGGDAGRAAEHLHARQEASRDRDAPTSGGPGPGGSAAPG